jgi:hypothetical protein
MAFPVIAAGGLAAAAGIKALYEYFNKKPNEYGMMLGREGGPISNLTPEQQKMQQLLLQNIPSSIQNIQNPSMKGFEPIGNLARFNWSTKTLPSLAERLSAPAAGGQSSGALGALGASGAQLEKELAAMGSQYQLNERSQNLDYLRNLMVGMQPSQTYMQREPGLPEAALMAYLGGTGGGNAIKAIGSMFGGSKPFDYAEGAKTNDYISNLLQGMGRGGSPRQTFDYGQTQESNPWLKELLQLRGTNPQDFFKNAGIMRG